MPTYYAVITTLGAQRLAEAQMSGIPLVFEEFAVGDGNGAPVTPAVGMTALVNETYRGDVDSVTISVAMANTVRIEGIIPPNSGGFTVREAGLFNAAGELIVVCNYPPTEKGTLGDGVNGQMSIRISLTYSDVEAIELTTDPNVITATREYVEDMTGGGLYLWESFT